MAERYLRYKPEEWEALPWWRQRMYVDGFVFEGFLQRDDEEATRAKQPHIPIEQLMRVRTVDV